MPRSTCEPGPGAQGVTALTELSTRGVRGHMERFLRDQITYMRFAYKVAEPDGAPPWVNREAFDIDARGQHSRWPVKGGAAVRALVNPLEAGVLERLRRAPRRPMYIVDGFD